MKVPESNQWMPEFPNWCFCTGFWGKWVYPWAFKNVFSVPYSSMFLFLYAIPFGFQSHVFWELVSPVQNLRVWAWCGTQISCSVFLKSTPYCGWLAPELVFLCVWDQVSVSPTVSKLSFYPLVAKALLIQFFRLFLEETISYIVVVFIASVGRREFRIFLCNHFPLFLKTDI